MTKINGQYNRGNAYINLALGILLAAKEDAQMWLDFIKEFDEDRQNHNPAIIADWVLDWIKTHPKQAALQIPGKQLSPLIKANQKEDN